MEPIDFFKKSEKQDDSREHFILKHLGGFQDQFTDDQKKAIMFSLFLIANSDGQDLAYRLSHDHLDDSLLDDFLNRRKRKERTYQPLNTDFLNIGKERADQLLSALDEGQKDWYIITVFGMLDADEQVLESKKQYVSYFFNSMGVTQQHCEDTIKKAALFNVLKMTPPNTN